MVWGGRGINILVSRIVNRAVAMFSAKEQHHDLLFKWVNVPPTMQLR